MATPPYPSYVKGGETSAPPPGYGPPPPAYGGSAPPPAAPYYQPQPQQQQQHGSKPQPKPKTSHGLFGSLSSIGRDVAKGFNSIATEASSVYSRSVHGDIVSQLVSGTTIILISRMSGRSLEIVQGPDGRLMLDAACQDSPHVFNNKWLVTKMGSWFHLSNYNNFLAIEGGNLVVAMNVQDHSRPPPSSRFKLHQMEHFLLLESAITPGQYVAATERGEIKPPAASSNDKFSHFGVQFVTTR
ncbi:hypothetical protein BOX15_Mlig027612g1 [Macrostomum lignano]|uniref:Uncharacterized protein n=1 Tax=Macrostomum lignano TaxID=282301 RepID=A0A267GUW0_9PLAT|nr:hypothetical protein BOX15_Mlig027612g1 [Macrostomum lignano]